MTEQHKYGKHYLIELWGCAPERIKDVAGVREVLHRAAVKSRATILEERYHQFQPHGVSGMIFIAESHFSIHTWPEDGYAGADILTCGTMSPELAIEEMKAGFCAAQTKITVIVRGEPGTAPGPS